MLETKTYEFLAFLGINILIRINHIQAIKDCWSVETRIMTRERILEILQQMHFAGNFQTLPPTDSEHYDCA